MTTQNQAILDGLASTVSTTKADLDKKTATYNALYAQVVELRRQADVHRAAGDNTDLQIVNGQLAPAQANMDQAKTDMDLAQTTYNNAFAAYQDAQNKLLTPEEKQAVLVKAQSDAAIAQGGVLAQKTTRYLIFGAIALTVIVIGIIIYKKKFAKG